MSSSSSVVSTNVGIDVSKGTLDIAVHETHTHWKITHEFAEFPVLVKSLKDLKPERIIIEASGGMENLLASHLAAASLPVIVVNPRQVRDFARATGQVAKTDRIDAFILARFGADLRPPIRELKSTETQELEALVARRMQIIHMLSAERARLLQAQQQRRPAIVKDIQVHMKWLQTRLRKYEKDLGQLVRSSPVWRESDKLFQSVPGVGPLTSFVLIADLPELGKINDKQIAALCGLAPHARESGTWHGKRTIGGGRARVRATLYMAALVATRCNLTIKTFYHRLLAAGKEKKVALTACMRKLLVILNTMSKNKTYWKISSESSKNT